MDWLCIVLCVGVVLYGLYRWMSYRQSQKDVRLVREAFMREFGLQTLSKFVTVKVNNIGLFVKNPQIQVLREDAYHLEFPTWMYAKSDGTADLRIRQNPIVWGTCYFYLGKYQVLTKRPDIMIKLVRELRAKGFEIPWCEQELEKWDRLSARYIQVFSQKQAEKIYRRFQLNPYRFEEFCTDLLNKMGYSAHTTKASNDGGYDIIGHNHTRETFVCECKCYEPTARIGRPLIQKLVGANYVVGAKHMLFITTCDFSKEAVEYAGQVGVCLINGPRLAKKAIQYGMVGGKKKERFDADLTLRDLRSLMSEDVFEKMIACK